jgi:hypothetical protein
MPLPDEVVRDIVRRRIDEIIGLPAEIRPRASERRERWAPRIARFMP